MVCSVVHMSLPFFFIRRWWRKGKILRPLRRTAECGNAHHVLPLHLFEADCSSHKVGHSKLLQLCLVVFHCMGTKVQIGSNLMRYWSHIRKLYGWCRMMQCWGTFPIIITLHFSCKNYRLPYTTTREALSGMEHSLTSLDTKLAS